MSSSRPDGTQIQSSRRQRGNILISSPKLHCTQLQLLAKREWLGRELAPSPRSWHPAIKLWITPQALFKYLEAIRFSYLFNVCFAAYKMSCDIKLTWLINRIKKKTPKNVLKEVNRFLAAWLDLNWNDDPLRQYVTFHLFPERISLVYHRSDVLPDVLQEFMKCCTGSDPLVIKCWSEMIVVRGVSNRTAKRF